MHTKQQNIIIENRGKSNNNDNRLMLTRSLSATWVYSDTFSLPLIAQQTNDRRWAKSASAEKSSTVRLSFALDRNSTHNKHF